MSYNVTKTLLSSLQGKTLWIPFNSNIGSITAADGTVVISRFCLIPRLWDTSYYIFAFSAVGGMSAAASTAGSVTLYNIEDDHAVKTLSFQNEVHQSSIDTMVVGTGVGELHPDERVYELRVSLPAESTDTFTYGTCSIVLVDPLFFSEG